MAKTTPQINDKLNELNQWYVIEWGKIIALHVHLSTLHQKACRTWSTITSPQSANQITDLWRCPSHSCSRFKVRATRAARFYLVDQSDYSIFDTSVTIATVISLTFFQEKMRTTDFTLQLPQPLKSAKIPVFLGNLFQLKDFEKSQMTFYVTKYTYAAEDWKKCYLFFIFVAINCSPPIRGGI